jgi:hypothetical protein
VGGYSDRLQPNGRGRVVPPARLFHGGDQRRRVCDGRAPGVQIEQTSALLVPSRTAGNLLLSTRAAPLPPRGWAALVPFAEARWSSSDRTVELQWSRPMVWRHCRVTGVAGAVGGASYLMRGPVRPIVGFATTVREVRSARGGSLRG